MSTGAFYISILVLVASFVVAIKLIGFGRKHQADEESEYKDIAPWVRRSGWVVILAVLIAVLGLFGADYLPNPHDGAKAEMPRYSQPGPKPKAPVLEEVPHIPDQKLDRYKQQAKDAMQDFEKP